MPAWLAVAASIGLGVSLLGPSSAAPTTPEAQAITVGLALTVNSAADTADTSPGDGACDTGADVGGGPECTLRAAIEEANAMPGADSIAFSVGSGVVTIRPGSGLPTITDPVVIDGTTQPGYAEPDGNAMPVVELDGASTGASANGLWISGGGSTVSALVIGGFGGSGILITGAAGNTVVKSHIGTDPVGKAANPNAYGVTIDNSKDHRIGTPTFGWSNVISGNGSGSTPDTGFGVRVIGPMASGNVITDNLIGEKRIGHGDVLDSLPNRGGILIDNAPDNTVGGPSGGNHILGNLGTGVLVRNAGATRNLVVGNCAGCAHQAADTNSEWDIRVEGAPGNTIRDNRINFGAASGQIRVEGAGASGNVIEGNEVSGRWGWGDPPAAIVISDAPDTLVGGETPGTGNSVGYGGPCVIVTGAGSTGTRVIGNGFGTCRDAGVWVETDGVNVSRNGFSMNEVGIRIRGDHAIVRGNSVLNSGFHQQTGQSFASAIGIWVEGDDALIGGTGSGEGNLVSGSFPMGFSSQGGVGIRVDGARVEMAGNRIGTNAAGTAQYHAQFVNQSPPYNSFDVYGNQGRGIQVYGADAVIGGTTVGLPCTGSCNLISGNEGGIFLMASNAVIEGNRIGTDIEGTAKIGNARGSYQGPGIEISRGGGHRIGGDALGAGNIITGNSPGISISDSAFDLIRGNSIYDNGPGLGIDLLESFAYGVTANDPADADEGANRLQNYPVIELAVEDFGVVVEGTLDSRASAAYTVDFFSLPSCAPSGFGEGDHPRGRVQITTDSAGLARFSTLLPSYAGDRYVTATATDADGNTSEFSACFTIDLSPAADAGPDQTASLLGPTVAVTLDGTASTDDDGDPLTYTWWGDFIESDASGPTPTVTFDHLGGHLIHLQVSDGRGGSDTDSLTVTVIRPVQSIDFGLLPDRTYGAEPFTALAVATSGLPVTFGSETPIVCTVSGTTVTLLAAGSCRIKATQPGDAEWQPAAPVVRSFTIGYDVSNVYPPSKTRIRSGSTLPVKFSLTDASGRPIPAPVAAAIGCPAATVTLDDGAPVCATYDAIRDLFQANIKTPKGLPVGTRHLLVVQVVTATGGTTVVVARAEVSVTIVR